jgi:hypothetical protein
MALFGTFLFGEELFGAHATLMVAPDLGWASADDMLDPSLNPNVIVWELEDMEVVTTPPARYKGKNSLIFEYQGVYYKLPASALGTLGSSGRHLWRIDTDPIQEFFLVKAALNVGPLHVVPAFVQPRILR